ncbi:MAG: hypothetical protein JO372_24305 [Solirubrobacterales bacterium]|nr:hypothetical protein [Solirubrobacterales bacterium]
MTAVAGAGAAAAAPAGATAPSKAPGAPASAPAPPASKVPGAAAPPPAGAGAGAGKTVDSSCCRDELARGTVTKPPGGAPGVTGVTVGDEFGGGVTATGLNGEVKAEGKLLAALGDVPETGPATGTEQRSPHPATTS